MNRALHGHRWTILLILIIVGAVGGCITQNKGTSNEKKLVIGVLPDENPKKIIEKTKPLEEYLEDRLGVEVDLYGTTDYASLVVAFENKKIDLAWFGGLSYLKARERSGAIPLVTASQKGSKFWHSVFITYPGSGITSMEDLKANSEEKTFVFGDPASTSGSLMPTYYLKHTWGIDREDFANIQFSGSHDATAFTIAGEHGDAGAMNNRIFDEMIRQGKIREGEDVLVIWRTPEYADYVWAANPDTVDEDLRGKIVRAFLEIDDPAVLEVQRAEGYIEVDDSFFKDLRSAAIELGFLEVGE